MNEQPLAIDSAAIPTAKTARFKWCVLVLSDFAFDMTNLSTGALSRRQRIHTTSGEAPQASDRQRVGSMKAQRDHAQLIGY
jgi:hypothetical protein